MLEEDVVKVSICMKEATTYLNVSTPLIKTHCGLLAGITYTIQKYEVNLEEKSAVTGNCLGLSCQY